jgi:predicted neutral ceramidase superfamily lipid hydrolase
MSYISQLVFTFDYAVVKFSILALLWDIFGVNRSNKRFIAIVSGTCIIWAIIFTFLCAFRCKNPVDSWTTDNPPELCIHTAYVFLPFESTNLFFDILILSIPVFAVQELKLSTWKKLSVMGIFLLGARFVVSPISERAIVLISWFPAVLVLRALYVSSKSRKVRYSHQPRGGNRNFGTVEF